MFVRNKHYPLINYGLDWFMIFIPSKDARLKRRIFKIQNLEAVTEGDF